MFPYAFINPIFSAGLTGFGPNINIVRDPRFGRNRCCCNALAVFTSAIR